MLSDLIQAKKKKRTDSLRFNIKEISEPSLTFKSNNKKDTNGSLVYHAINRRFNEC